MGAAYRYLHLHGFASSHRSRKGVHLRRALQRRGVVLELPDLNRPDFERQTYTAALAHLDEIAARQDAAGDPRPWRLSGSSLGGYLAARWAEGHPGRVDRLALLCPAFDLPAQWEALLGPAALRRWATVGHLLLPDATGRPRPVHWELVTDARRHPPRPAPPCPTLIIHGRADEVLPIESSRSYATAHADRARLVEVEGDHSLMAALPRVTDELLSFYDLAGPGVQPAPPNTGEPA